MIESSPARSRAILAILGLVTIVFVGLFVRSVLTRSEARVPDAARVRTPRATTSEPEVRAPQAVPTVPAAPVVSKTVRIVSAANFAANGNCHDHYTDGCDLFSGTLDLSTGAVSGVTRLTSDSLGEAFPQMTADGRTVAFTRYAESGGDDAMVADLGTATSRVFAHNVSHVFPMPDGSNFIVTALPGFKLEKISSANTDQNATSTPLVSGVFEPHVSPDGLKVAYYATTGGESRGSGTAQAKVYVFASGKTVDASDADGTAHCFWNVDGTKLYCNNRKNGGVIVRSVASDGTMGTASVGIAFPSVAALSAVDPAFATGSCVSTSVEYGSFCDDTHVILTAACMVQSNGTLDQGFTHAVLLDLSSGTYLPVGAAMASAFGGPGSNSWTTTCGAL